MSREDKLRIIGNYKNHVLNNVAAAFEYENWSDDFKLKEIKEAYDKFQEQQIDFREFTKEELHSIGFVNWDENLVLMPLWAYHICKEGITLTSINDDTAIKGKDEIDTDIRYGCIPYGFTTKELFKRERKIKLEEIESKSI